MFHLLLSLSSTAKIAFSWPWSLLLRYWVLVWLNGWCVHTRTCDLVSAYFSCVHILYWDLFPVTSTCSMLTSRVSSFITHHSKQYLSTYPQWKTNFRFRISSCWDSTLTQHIRYMPEKLSNGSHNPPPPAAGDTSRPTINKATPSGIPENFIPDHSLVIDLLTREYRFLWESNNAVLCSISQKAGSDWSGLVAGS